MVQMVTAREYCKRNGYKRASVNRWLQEGLMPGAKKVINPCSPTGYSYLMPVDAVPQRRKEGRPKKGCEPERAPFKPTATKAKRVYTKREAALYLRKHALTKTYGEISRETGFPVMELRAMYDRLHKRYGI